MKHTSFQEEKKSYVMNVRKEGQSVSHPFFVLELQNYKSEQSQDFSIQQLHLHIFF